MEILFIFLILSVVVGIMANKRRRSVLGWVLLSLIISPVLVIIILFALGENPEGNKICPHCAERIKDEALVCRYCGNDVSGQ